MTWHIVTCEYPPQSGGVGDYTRHVARGLAEAGDEVHVWGPACREASPADSGVEVHRLPDRFGPRGLAALSRALRRFPAPRRLLVQYVPHGFGYKGMNVPFCLWLNARREDSVWIMFHEVRFLPAWRQSPARNVLAFVTWTMAWLAGRSAERIWISIPAWERLIPRRARGKAPIAWLPVPSNIARCDDPAATAAVRRRYAGPALVGHFGTYGVAIAESLTKLLPALPAGCSALLLGRGSEAFRERAVARDPRLAPHLQAAGALEPEALSHHVSACDLMIQPYPDGASARRTSLMIALAHGRPAVTTEGVFTEPLWGASGAVALAPAGDTEKFAAQVRALLENEPERRRMSGASEALYRNEFALSRTIAALRAAPWET